MSPDIAREEVAQWAREQIEKARDRLETNACQAVAEERGRIVAMRDLIAFLEPPKPVDIQRPTSLELTAGPKTYA